MSCPPQFLEEWFSASDNYEYLNKPSFEQRRLNQLAPWYKQRLAVVPYREMTGPEGTMITHLWSMVAEEERKEVALTALMELLSVQGFF